MATATIVSSASRGGKRCRARPQPVHLAMLDIGSQLSGAFLATRVNLSVTGPPARGEDTATANKGAAGLEPTTSAV